MILSRCKIIGLTGGIASGKSTVSNILKKKQYTLIDADIIAREVVEKDEPAYVKIVNEFGTSILMDDKSLNRVKLGEIVFSNPQSLKKLNDITHPYIFKKIKREIQKHCKKREFVFVDIPLLFEEEDQLVIYDIYFDEVWLVYIDEKTQIDRLMKRNKIGIEEAKNRIKLQISMEEKRNKATKIVDNTGSTLNLQENVEKLLKEL